LLRVRYDRWLGLDRFPLVDDGVVNLVRAATSSLLELDLEHGKLTFLELRPNSYSWTAEDVDLARVQRIRTVDAQLEKAELCDAYCQIPADVLSIKLARGLGERVGVLCLRRVNARRVVVDGVVVAFSDWDASCPLRELSVRRNGLVGHLPRNVNINFI
jgi:hypothetical protein